MAADGMGPGDTGMHRERTPGGKNQCGLVLAGLLVVLSAGAGANSSCTKSHSSQQRGNAVAKRIDVLIEKRLPMLQRGDFHLSGEHLTDDELAAVLADPQVPELRFLTLTDNQLTARAVPILLSSAKTRELRWLHLSSNPIGDAGLAALAASERLAHVTFLSLVAIKATCAGLQSLVHSRLSAIETLQLGWQDLGDDGARTLTALPPLKKLDLTRSAISGAGARVLLSSTQAEQLILAENPMGAGGLRTLASLGSRLSSLDLTQTGLSATDMAVLAKLDVRLQHLVLAQCPLEDEGMRQLARARWLSRLQSLDVMHAKSTPAGRQELRAAWGQRPGLTLEHDRTMLP